MGTLTTNYQFQKPTIGADDDVWGTDFSGGDPINDPSPGLNGNWEKNDQLIKNLQDQLDTLINTTIPDLISQLEIPVGGLYHSASDTDPATTLGYGTWEAFAAGRAIVGVGTSNTTDAKVWAAEEEDGLESHTLLEAEMAAHTHGAGTLATNSAGNHSHSITFNSRKFSGDNNTCSDLTSSGTSRNTSTAGAHTHTISGATAENVGDQPHNNIQPSIAVYIWKRLT